MSIDAWLIDLLIKSSLILATGLGCCALLRRRSAALRHMTLLLTVGGLLALPFIRELASRFPDHVPALPAYTSIVESISLALPDAQPQEFGGSPLPDSVRPGPAAGSNPATVGTGATSAGTGAASAGTGLAGTVSAAGLISAIYVVIAALIAGRYGLIRLTVGRRLRRLAPIEDRRIVELVAAVCAHSDLERTPRLATGPDGSSPWIWGLRRPVIVLPRDFTRWSAAEQRQALLHEIAHLRRHDHLTALLTQLTCTLYWINPLVWVAAKRLRIEAERACDDEVLLAGAEPASYADQLLAIARTAAGSERNSIWTAAMASRSSLGGRIRGILEPDTRRNNMNKRLLIALTVAAVTIVLPLSVLRSQNAAPAEQTPALGSPEVQRIIRTGPASSEELETLVTAYAANDMMEAVTRTFTQYLTREDREQDRLCEYCRSIASIPTMDERPPLTRALEDAENAIGRMSEEAGIGDYLVNVAMVRSGAGGSGVRGRQNADIALYYLTYAAQLGISDDRKMDVILVLIDVRHFEAALEIADSIHSDPASMHYQSTDTQSFIRYIESELDRRELIGSTIVAAGKHFDPTTQRTAVEAARTAPAP
jgi:beta-lactamase regulating signal transducer with metallopeptidase domain